MDEDNEPLIYTLYADVSGGSDHQIIDLAEEGETVESWRAKSEDEQQEVLTVPSRPDPFDNFAAYL